MINRSLEQEQELKIGVDNTVDQLKKGDAFAQVSYQQAVHFEQDKLQSIDDVSHSAIACRLFNEDNKVGNSTINDPNDFKSMIQSAKESSFFGKEDHCVLPKMHEYPTWEWMCHTKNLQYSKQELKDRAEDLLQKIKKIHPSAKVSTSVYNGYGSLYLKNTSGFCGFYEESSLVLQGGLFLLDSDGSFLEFYEREVLYDQEISDDRLLKSLSWSLENSLKKAKLKKSGLMPVIFAPSVIDMLLTPIEIAANGKTLYKEMSLFENRIGEMMFDPKFSFMDDPTLKYGSGSVLFDDEGTKVQKRDIIQNGVFKQFIYDCSTAHKMNTESTGHASRGLQSLPGPSFGNRIIGLGDVSLEEMIASVDYGIYLETALGEGQSNVMAGDFSVLGESAYLIEKGQLKGKVKDIMISGNSLELFKNIAQIENKHTKESSLITPHILLDSVMISKK